MKEGKGKELSSLPVLLPSASCCRREEGALGRQPPNRGRAVQLTPPQHCVCLPASPADGNAASGKVRLPVSLFSSSKFKLFIRDGRTECKRFPSQSLHLPLAVDSRMLEKKAKLCGEERDSVEGWERGSQEHGGRGGDRRIRDCFLPESGADVKIPGPHYSSAVNR